MWQLCCPFLFLISSRVQNSVLQFRLFQRFISSDRKVIFMLQKWFRRWLKGISAALRLSAAVSMEFAFI